MVKPLRKVAVFLPHLGSQVSDRRSQSKNGGRGWSEGVLLLVVEVGVWGVRKSINQQDSSSQRISLWIRAQREEKKKSKMQHQDCIMTLLSKSLLITDV